jgi:hypothetical protein
LRRKRPDAAAGASALDANKGSGRESKSRQALAHGGGVCIVRRSLSFGAVGASQKFGIGLGADWQPRLIQQGFFRHTADQIALSRRN